ncbi:MAG: RtcB family protein [Candidatus Poseidoniales archaeon]|nr:RtcB family protein [Candidatus Poseidoniales archaeon]
MTLEWEQHIEKVDEALYRINRHGSMRTDAMLVADEAHFAASGDDRSPGQLVNTATLPGIVGDAWAMADWHFGYGFPIGGVVATDLNWGEQGGVISPGGVGFDINCGVRLCSTDLEISQIPDLARLAKHLANRTPAGASGKGGVLLENQELQSILEGGAEASADLGWGLHEDLSHIESNGILEGDVHNLSQRAMKRGSKSLGTLGSGNHFLELQVVDRVEDEQAAKAFGLRLGQICAMIHTGSRGLGHQVCSEHVAALESKYRNQGGNWYSEHWDISLPDRQLAAAPFHSKEGQDYFSAMQSAGNFAFANRSALTKRLRDNLAHHLGNDDANVKVVYDVCHNIAKVEEHVIHGTSCSCCVHRKGATRSLGGDHTELATRFSGIGQPVLIPGDMGTASWVLAGPKSGSNDAFASSCHGAGRQLSRAAARKSVDSEELLASLKEQGIHVHTRTPNILAEEAPQAYKNVDDVIRLTSQAGLARPVVRLRPLAVIKG